MNTTYQETRSILRLTIPIAAATILEGSVYFLNTWMMAKLGADTLAAGALITNLFSTLAMVFWGIFSSNSSLFARYLSENNSIRVAKLFGTSNLLSVVAGVLMGFVLWNSHFLLTWTGQPTSTIQISTAYAHGLAFAEIPDLLTFSLFNFLQGADRAAATFWLSMLYVPLNVFSNYVLVFGKLGLPALGAAGIGYGTCISYTLLFLAIVIYLLLSPLREHCWRPLCLSISAAKELIFIGGPVGVTWGIGYLYLFFDTIRFLFTGALLGLKDTMFLLWTALLTWVVIGAPLVYITAQFSMTHPQNIFGALIFCELLGTLILARRYYQKIQKLQFI